MKSNRYPKIRQADRRFCRPVDIHVASARAIERIARKHGISAHTRRLSPTSPALVGKRSNEDNQGE